jgi:hypothetical protein
MQVDLKVLKPFGVILVLGCTVLMLIVCFTADMGVPETYVSIHDTDYYAQNAGTMAELKSELEEYVFPNLEGIDGAWVGSDNRLVIAIAAESYDRTRAVILRDFDESLFTFIKAEE